MSEPDTTPDPGHSGDGFRQLDERPIYAGRIFSVAEGRFADPDDHQFERSIVRHPGAVAVVAVDDLRRATLIRQYRPAVDRWILEIPAGTCDVQGEDTEATAHRELGEEVGLAAGSLRRLVGTRNSPGFCDQLTIVYLATDLRPTATGRTGVEERFMTTEQVELEAVPRLIAVGELVDQTSALGLLLAREALAGRF